MVGHPKRAPKTRAFENGPQSGVFWKSWLFAFVGQKRRLSITIISFTIQRVHDLHISQIHLVCRSEFCGSIVIYFSWEYCYIQEESKTKVIQSFGVHNGRCANGQCPVIWTGELFQNATCRRVFFFVNGKTISVFKNIWVRADKT